MKFYYNDKLVRTSKTHEYHYGVWNPMTEKMESCHGTLDGAKKELRRRISEHETSIADEKAAIKALENGKTYILVKCCRTWTKISLRGKDLYGDDRSKTSTWEAYIKENEESIKALEKRQIVELEARA